MSSPTLAAVRGMNDVLPVDIGAWQHLEKVTRELFASYGYEEVRVPVVEQTGLFKRAIGEYTDIVEKEMYTFSMSADESLTLRPEATAGVARAAITNGLLRGARLKLWTTGPMFRHEKPQKGRYRQFHQYSVEALGFAGPDIDIELIALSARLWKQLGLTRVKLKLNSLGTIESRRVYREHLVTYFTQHAAALDADSQRRLGGNPLRILDSKNPTMQAVVSGAPVLTDYLDAESREHFETICATLTAMNITYTIDPRLVRGLDYYSRTVFEWITDALGSQDAVCSGGRYDGLIAQLGGEPTPAVGYAMGVERVVELMQQAGNLPQAQGADVYVIASGERATRAGLALVETLRDALPALRFEMNQGGGNFKAQFRRADRSGARMALVLGDNELERGAAALKPLRQELAQLEVPLAELATRIPALLATL
ncbi:MAG: histidine--tRNA ligase [Pseudomonadota bacterium]